MAGCVPSARNRHVEVIFLGEYTNVLPCCVSVGPPYPMKNVLVIIMLVLLPLQAFAAMERGLAHLLGGGYGTQVFAKHLIEHEEHVAHHHDAHGSPHDDGSPQSIQHLTDFEHQCASFMPLPMDVQLAQVTITRIAPDIRCESYSDHIPLHPLRPPRYTA